MQLTAKRDVLMSDLEKTRQLLQKANTDAMHVRKLSEESSTLRHRKNGAVSGKSGNEVSHHSMAGKVLKEQGVRAFSASQLVNLSAVLTMWCCHCVSLRQTFGPLHLIVCAIIFFLVGRYC